MRKEKKSTVPQKVSLTLSCCCFNWRSGGVLSFLQVSHIWLLVFLPSRLLDQLNSLPILCRTRPKTNKESSSGSKIFNEAPFVKTALCSTWHKGLCCHSNKSFNMLWYAWIGFILLLQRVSIKAFFNHALQTFTNRKLYRAEDPTHCQILTVTIQDCLTHFSLAVAPEVKIHNNITWGQRETNPCF